MANIALLIGGQVGADAVRSVRNYTNIFPVFDKSFSGRKFFKLLRNRSISLKVLINVLLFEIANFKIADLSIYRSAPRVRSNSDLFEFVKKNNVTHLVLLNANLIIKPSVFEPNLELLNIHCIDPDKYPGLGGFERALANSDFSQFAALHKITSAIDKGLIVLTNPYEFKRNKSVVANRRIAFKSGLELFHIWFGRLK